jgi:integrase
VGSSLSKDTSDAPRLLRFIILTACRYREAVRANWSEIRRDVWTVPASRMKGGREHSVPLSSAAMEVLGEPGEGLIFPSSMPVRRSVTCARQNWVWYAADDIL